MEKGKINIVSTSDGNPNNITQTGLNMLYSSDIIVGFNKYIEDISEIIKDKEVYSSGMTKEVERCKYAIQKSLENKNVCIISNGDANVYGMASLVLEIVEENDLWNKIDINIEPGITALLFAASKSGAPLSGDFAVISLSDLLTPIEKIENRLTNTLIADFVICIYNPLSKSRNKPYKLFLELLAKHRLKDTPIVIAKNIGRKNEDIIICSVEELVQMSDNTEIINMSTVIIVGNSMSRFANNKNNIITPRGYNSTYNLKL